MGKILDETGLAELVGKVKAYSAKKPLSGTSAPTLATVGEIGQIYVDTTNKVAYICTQITSGAYTWQKLWSSVDTSSWSGIRDAVRMGYGEALFPVGYEFDPVSHTDSRWGSGIIWQVVGHDQILDPSGTYQHSMTLLSKYLDDSGVQFDQSEAMYYCETALSAGTYNFVATAYSSWAAGTYQFTLTQSVPAGGQLCLSGNAGTALTSLYVDTYSSRTSTSRIERVAITSGSDGTNLGTWATDAMNHPQRISYGSNNYKESAVEQYLNSSASAGSVWTPQTKFDRPPSWVSSLAGFMNGLNSEFLDVVGNITVKCSANNVYEAPDSTVTKGTAYTITNKKFFLPSRMEIFGDSDIADGSVRMTYYVGSENADRIKYRSNSQSTAASWWLRTPYSSAAYYVRRVASSGAMDSSYAYVGYRVAPACVIY